MTSICVRALPADQREHDDLDEDVARLSPLHRANLSMLGLYSFQGSSPAAGGLRPASAARSERAGPR
ncbi:MULTISPECIES: hypothetical protein [Streptomyces]|uniref:hypothetical protein n=1 Tax=Streptomyces TaxID=1883 RepID=UPI0018DEF38F|nr:MULTISPECIES: hypothetical protein [Streptomyces]MCZ4102464.1 hypothetical protein [Streptomyces sp. H39-C1]